MLAQKKAILLVVILGLCFVAYKLIWSLLKIKHIHPGYPVPGYVYLTEEVVSKLRNTEMYVLERDFPKRYADWSVKTMEERNRTILEEQSGKVHAKDVAIVTMIVKDTKSSNIPSFSSYQEFVSFVIDNFVSYAQKFGYPFYFQNRHLVNLKRKVYWGKLDILRHYFKQGYSWVMWTDVDILIMNHDVKLETFIESVPDDAHFIAVLESRKLHISSGFFLMRNSKESLEILDYWDSLYEEYKDSFTPEQDALEYIARQQKWKKYFYFFPSFVLTAFSECYILDKTFSVHFVNTERKWYISEWSKRVKRVESDFSISIY
jgi:hypothetical protein